MIDHKQFYFLANEISCYFRARQNREEHRKIMEEVGTEHVTNLAALIDADATADSLEEYERVLNVMLMTIHKAVDTLAGKRSVERQLKRQASQLSAIGNDRRAILVLLETMVQDLHLDRQEDMEAINLLNVCDPETLPRILIVTNRLRNVRPDRVTETLPDVIGTELDGRSLPELVRRAADFMRTVEQGRAALDEMHEKMFSPVSVDAVSDWDPGLV